MSGTLSTVGGRSPITVGMVVILSPSQSRILKDRAGFCAAEEILRQRGRWVRFLLFFLESSSSFTIWRVTMIGRSTAPLLIVGSDRIQSEMRGKIKTTFKELAFPYQIGQDSSHWPKLWFTGAKSCCGRTLLILIPPYRKQRMARSSLRWWRLPSAVIYYRNNILT